MDRTVQGFTLLEIAIVLIIIGLIVGSILAGQELIKSSQISATITQRQKFDSAVNMFRLKYNGLPGDLQVSSASQFGFSTTGCDGSPSSRDGNGLIDGYPGYVLGQGLDETGLFWADLSVAGFVDGTFPNGGLTVAGCWGLQGTVLSQSPGTTYIGNYLPAAKIGQGNFWYVYETNGSNWFGLSAATAVNPYNWLSSGPGLTTAQAYNIDKKIDDGIATTGNVVAVYLNNNSAAVQSAYNTTTAGGYSWTCYDTTTTMYSTSQNGGTGLNCALSFKMQGAAR